LETAGAAATPGLTPPAFAIVGAGTEGIAVEGALTGGGAWTGAVVEFAMLSSTFTTAGVDMMENGMNFFARKG